MKTFTSLFCIHPRMFSWACILRKMNTFLWKFPGYFQKILAKNPKQIRSDQILATVNVLKHRIIIRDISSWNEFFWKSTLKRNYVKKRRPSDFTFWYFENLSKRNIKITDILKYKLSIPYQNNYFEVASIFHLLKLHEKNIKTTSIFCPSKLNWTKDIKATSKFHPSKLRQKNYVKTKSIFLPSNYIEENISKWRQFFTHQN